jgi:hypothetical protein
VLNVISIVELRIEPRASDIAYHKGIAEAEMRRSLWKQGRLSPSGPTPHRAAAYFAPRKRTATGNFLSAARCPLKAWWWRTPDRTWAATPSLARD